MMLFGSLETLDDFRLFRPSLETFPLLGFALNCHRLVLDDESPNVNWDIIVEAKTQKCLFTNTKMSLEVKF